MEIPDFSLDEDDEASRTGFFRLHSAFHAFTVRISALRWMLTVKMLRMLKMVRMVKAGKVKQTVQLREGKTDYEHVRTT